MTMEFIDELIMPIITAGCLCVGYVMKKWLPTDDKWIPTTLLFLGAVSGIILFGIDYEGVVKGMVSGVAAVGFHQVVKQHFTPNEPYELTEKEALEWMEQDETALDDLKGVDDNE